MVLTQLWATKFVAPNCVKASVPTPLRRSYTAAIARLASGHRAGPVGAAVLVIVGAAGGAREESRSTPGAAGWAGPFCVLARATT